MELIIDMNLVFCPVFELTQILGCAAGHSAHTLRAIRSVFNAFEWFFRCREKEEPSVWFCHSTGRLRGRHPSQTRGEVCHYSAPEIICHNPGSPCVTLLRHTHSWANVQSLFNRNHRRNLWMNDKPHNNKPNVCKWSNSSGLRRQKRIDYWPFWCTLMAPMHDACCLISLTQTEHPSCFGFEGNCFGGKLLET